MVLSPLIESVVREEADRMVFREPKFVANRSQHLQINPADSLEPAVEKRLKKDELRDQFSMTLSVNEYQALCEQSLKRK